MKRGLPMAGCLLLLFCISACVSTETDPRKGGLFSYNPKAYEKRIEERKETLAATEADTQQAKQEGQQLEASMQKKQAEHEAVKSKLAALYSECGKLQKKLKQMKTANAGQEKELKRIQDEVDVVRSNILKINNSPSSDDAKKAQLAKLQNRMDELLQEAEALSGL